jgi:hypothetical protein
MRRAFGARRDALAPLAFPPYGRREIGHRHAAAA